MSSVPPEPEPPAGPSPEGAAPQPGAPRRDTSDPAAQPAAADAAAAAQDPAAPEDRVEAMSLRRAPKLLTFLTTGAALGAVIGLLAGVWGPGAVFYTRGAIVGFFLVLGVVLGAGGGALLGLALDRISLRRSRGVTAQIADVHTGDERPGP